MSDLSRNNVLMTLMLALLLAGCGGGGSGSSAGDSSGGRETNDESPTKPAPVTVAFPVNNAAPPATPGTARSLLTVVAAGIERAHALGTLTFEPKYSDFVYTKNFRGSGGGSAEVTIVYHKNGVGDWHRIVFDHYTIDGVEVNGEVLEEITGPRYDVNRHPYRTSYREYQVKTAGYSSTVTGTVERLPPEGRSRGPLVANLKLHNSSSSRYLYLEDFVLRDVLYPTSVYSDERALEIDGVIHDMDSSGNGLSFDVATWPGEGLKFVVVDGVRTFARGRLRLPGFDSNVMSIELLNAYLFHLTVEKDGVYEGYRLSWIENELADAALNSLVKPVATASFDPDDSYFIDNEVTLDARFSIGPKDAPLRYSWEIVNRPSGSKASVRNSTAPLAQITPDTPGSYAFRLTVSDGMTEAHDLLEIQAYDDQNGGMPARFAAHAQLIPSASDPEKFVVDTRTVRDRRLNEIFPLSRYEKLGESDEQFEVEDTTWLVDRAGAEGFIVEGSHQVCCSQSILDFRAVFDRPDFAPRLYPPFRIMNLPLSYIDTARTLVHAEITDMDGDGQIDVLATPFQLGMEYGYPEENLPGVYVRHGLSEGGFTDIQRVDVGNGSRFAVGDVDGGGIKDIVAGSDYCSFDVAFGTGSGFSGATNVSLAGVCEPITHDYRVSGERDFVVHDLDNDGQPTIVTIASNNIDIELIDLDASGNVVRRRTLIVDAATGFHKAYIQQIVVLDMNLDGLADMAISEKGASQGRVIFFLQNADGSFTKEDPIATGENYGPHLSVGDFNGDGNDDLASSFFMTSRVWGSTAEGPAVIYEIDLTGIPGNHHLGADWGSFADLDSDSDEELLLFGRDNWVLVIDRLDGPEPVIRTAWMMIPDDESRAPGFSSLGFTSAPAVEDIDGDGKLDFLLFLQSGVYTALGKRD